MSNNLQIMVGVFPLAFCFIWLDYWDYWPQIIKRIFIK